MITVNGEEADPGCWVAGHHGQYAPDRLADICEQFGLKVLPLHDPRQYRAAMDAEDPDEIPVHLKGMSREWLHEQVPWAEDALMELLQEATEGGHWEWEEGELFLWEDVRESDPGNLVVFVESGDIVVEGGFWRLVLDPRQAQLLARELGDAYREVVG